jgi:large subunit ribosomal protein L24
MAKLSIRRGDRVKVIRGNHKDQEGTVIRVEREKNRVVVQGVNIRKRHRKPTATAPEGGIVEFEAPIHASNVMLIDPRSGEPTRVRSALGSDGKRERISVKSGQAIPRA